MRLFICHLLVFLVLFMSAEGAWDMAKESHAHRDNTAHQLDVDGHTPANSDPLSDGAGNQCGHLCHGHTSSITGSSTELVSIESSNYHVIKSSPHSSHFQAPPTPPPNA
jgi:hypothetical protein